MVPAAAPNASERLAAFVNDLPGHIPLWIDLEGQYTLAGVVGAIIDQCRTYDPALTPSVLPLQEDAADAIKKGTGRVLDALSRARYVLALDCLEAYTWPHTFHHGDWDDNDVTGKQGKFLKFLKALMAKADALHGSLICVSIDQPEPRQTGPGTKAKAANLDNAERDLKTAQKMVEEWCYPHPRTTELNFALRTEGKGLERVLVSHPGVDPKGSNRPDWATLDASLALLSLSCFRARRNGCLRTILDHLVKPAVGEDGKDPYRRIDTVLDWFVQEEYLLPVAGGGYWMKKSLATGFTLSIPSTPAQRNSPGWPMPPGTEVFPRGT